MTLHDFLRLCSKEDYVGICDLDYSSRTASERRKYKRPFEGIPSQQHYLKIDNIPYGKIRYFLDKEVCGINHTEKGYLVRIHTEGKARKYLDMCDLAREIAKEIKRECK